MSRDKVLFEKSKVRQRGRKGGERGGAADKVRVWGRSKAGNGNHPLARASHFRKREKITSLEGRREHPREKKGLRQQSMSVGGIEVGEQAGR